MMEVMGIPPLSADDSDGGQIITFVNADDLDSGEGAEVEAPFVHHVLSEVQDASEKSLAQLSFTVDGGVSSKTPCCLVCNAKLGVSARGAMNIFSNQVKTSNRQINLSEVLSSIICKELSSSDVHSDIVCRKCFKLVDDINSLEGQLVIKKQDVVSKYTRTLAVVKQSNEMTILNNDAQDLEADSALTKDDRDFRVYMASGRPRKNKRGRGRRNLLHPIKLEVKEETDDELISFNNVVNTSDVFRNKNNFSLLNDKSKDNTQVTLNVDVGEKDADMLMMENMLTVEGVMEVDDLQLVEDDTNDSGLQIPNLCNLNGQLTMSTEDIDPLGGDEEVEKYKCRFCSVKMQELIEMHNHIKQNHADRLFECKVCEAKLTTKEDLLEHYQQHSTPEEKAYNSKFSSRRFVQPQQLKDQQRTQVAKTVACTECHKLFRSEFALQEHYNTHTNEKPYCCDQCDKKFTSRHILKNHLKTHGVRERPHQCELCNKSFLTPHHLNDHMNIHQKKKSFMCHACDKTFTTQRGLDLHSYTHSGIKNFSCKVCKKRFARKNEVDDHERTHTGEKPFQCEICGATFCQRSNLQSHKKATHLKEKKYQCQICHKAFKRRRLLVYHGMSVHTGERPYKCENCGASFVYPDHYRKHLRIHTGEKPYKCDICGKAFNSRDNRNAHKFIHSDKKPYECIRCGAGFMRRPMIVSHFKTHNITENFDANIKINPPSVVDIESPIMITGSPVGVHSVKLDDDHNLEASLNSQVTFVRDGIQDGDVEVTRPAHIIDDLHRYIIHATDRSEDNVSHFFTSFQGQVVELNGEQLALVTDNSTQADPTIVIPQVAVGNDLRPFQIQLEQSDREMAITPGQVLREVTATIISTSSTSSSSSQFHTSNAFLGTNKQFETRESSTLRKILSERENISLESRSGRSWHQTPSSETESDFINS